MPLNNPWGETVREIVLKTADQTVNDSIVKVNDTHLKLAVGFNQVWIARLILLLNSTTVADWEAVFVVPAGTTGYWKLGTEVNSGRTLVTAVPVSTTGVIAQTIFELLIMTGGTAGDVQLTWAQKVAEATDTKVLENSCILAWQIN